MITLNEIAYNIKNLAYGGVTSTENTISLRQIKHWIHYHRAKLIADNIDKGITNIEALYQKMPITLRNSTSGQARDFYDAWDAYDIDSSLTPPTISSEFLKNHPKVGTDRLNGEWLALSSLSVDSTGSSQAWTDAPSRSFYGDEIISHQNRGDFRNLGSHNFWTPRPLQLKNNQGIKNVRLERFSYFPDDPITTLDEQKGGYQKKSIPLYRKNNASYDDHNKFTDNSKPYYIAETAKIGRDDGYSGRHYIGIRGIQVSPNYHADLDAPGIQKVFWKYRATASMILENPTEIEIMVGLWFEYKPKWDDDKTPYPIPMEYVSDLIQRVLQVEMQTEIKTTPDVITDGLDDNIKQKASGTQVQR